MKSAISRRISPPSLHLTIQHRNFINARVKWVRDPLLDTVVEREKNLLPCLSLKSLLLSSPCLSLPLSHPSLHNHFPSHITTTTTTTPLHLFHKYPSLFRIFRPPSDSPSPSLPHHVKLTPQFLTLHHEEQRIHDPMPHKHLAARRLLKFLMLTRAFRVPLSIIDAFKFDLGIPQNYLIDLVSYFPDYFRVCQMNCDVNSQTSDLGLELVSWKKDFAVPAILNEFNPRGRGGIVEFPMYFTPGFDLPNKVKDWVNEWQSLPYISPYEDAFHLSHTSDQADKWAVSVLHELLSILVSKKTEVKNVLKLGDYLGFGLRFKKALAHHPGIFYVSNKIRTQTVLLRQAFRKDWLIDNHPLMGMRHRYIYLMSKSRKRKKFTKLSTKHNLRIHGVVN